MMHHETDFDAVAARSLSTLHLASMVCPGVVWMTKGYVLRAIVVNTAFVLMWVLYGMAWTVLKFTPIVPTLWFFLMWLFLLYLNARDAAVAPMRSEVPVAAFANGIVSFVTWFVPLTGLTVFFWKAIATILFVGSGSMFPTVIPGDVLWVDHAIPGGWPEYGDMVVYTSPQNDRPTIGRVVGLPGDYVSFEDGRLVSSQAHVSYSDFDGSQDNEFLSATGYTPAAVRAQYEVFEDIVYPIAALDRSDTAQRYNGHEWSVQDYEIFVLNDNRGHDDDSRTFGPINAQRVIGIPLYVVWSRAKDARVRKHRTGAMMQTRRDYVPHDPYEMPDDAPPAERETPDP